jgi:upstream activation factor subunit UAF30
MARTSKATKTSADAPVETPVVEKNVVSAAPVAEKAPKAKKAAAPKKEAAPVVEVAPVASPAPVVADAPAEAVEGDAAALHEQSLEFNAKLQQLSVLISGLKTEYRALEKKWARELKAAQKQNSKRKRKSGNRAPSGFVKPTRISDELASFLGKEKGTEMARTSVTRDINAYIRNNKLQDEKNGRKINPDAKLASLLKLQKTDELTYFNLQRFMSPHFAKTAKPEATA